MATANGKDGEQLPAQPDDRPDSPPVGGHYWVSLSYDIFDATGQPVDDVRRNLTYLHGGYGEVLPKIEAALEGQSVGYSCSLYLEPEDAFGDYDADLIAMIPVESLPEGAEVGMSFDGVPGQAADGNIYNLTDIAQGQAVLDGNHPLAGIALRYEVTVDAIREASDEEIELEQKAAAKSRD